MGPQTRRAMRSPLVPPFVNNMPLDLGSAPWHGEVSLCPSVADVLIDGRPAWTHSGMRSGVRSVYDTRLVVQLWSRLWKYTSVEKYVCAHAAGHCPTKKRVGHASGDP